MGIDLREISITDIEGIRIGHAQDYDGLTGCTAIICDDGAMAGVEVRGGGPASRETELLDPLKNCQAIHCVMFSGGSAFGLAACDGAMEYLEEHGIGYKIRDLVIPLVCGGSIFDLTVGDPKARPDKAMGYAACAAAGKDPASGKVGAGTGASVGKLGGPAGAERTGLGIYACEKDGVKCGAVAVVNALGDVIENGKIIAGMRGEDGEYADSSVRILDLLTAEQTVNRENTTLVCVVTNAKLTKDQANKIAQVAHNGFARTIEPVHTSMDGDLCYVMATGEVHANADALGSLAAEVTRRAIVAAAKSE